MKEGKARCDADVLEHGWPAKDRELVAWLDKLYAGEWPAMLKQAADLPTSPFDDVRNGTILEPIPATVNSSDVAVALALRRTATAGGRGRRGVCRKSAHRPSPIAVHCADRAPAMDLIFGRTVEGTLLKGLDRWLEKLHSKPDLIRQSLALLSRHLDETVDDGKDMEAIEALIGQNTLDVPLSLLDQYMSFYDGPTRQVSISTSGGKRCGSPWPLLFPGKRLGRFASSVSSISAIGNNRAGSSAGKTNSGPLTSIRPPRFAGTP